MASIRISASSPAAATAAASPRRPASSSSSIPQANLPLRSPLCRASADIGRRLPGGQQRRSSFPATASVVAASSAAGKDSDSSSSPFDLEDELAALDAAVLDDLAEAGALADLSRGDPGEKERGAKVERPVPTDPSKRHRKRRAGEKGLSAAFLRALTEEAMSGGGGVGMKEEEGEGGAAAFPSYGGFEQFGGEGGGGEEEEEEDGFLPVDDGGDDGDGDGGAPSSSSSTSLNTAVRARPGAGDVLTQDELDAAPPGFRAGYVALVGRPNAGKSTLLNALLGRKLSIVTPKAQTTRQRVLGIASGPSCQMVLLDTPGLLRGGRAPDALDRRMAAAVSKATADADAVLALVDASAPGAAGAAQEAVAKLVVAAAVGAATSRRKKKRKERKGKKELSREESETETETEAMMDEEEVEEAARALEAVRIALGARQQQRGQREEEDEEEDEEDEEEDGVDDDASDDGGEEREPISTVAALAAANAAANSSSSSGRTPVAILLNKVDAAAPGRVDEIEAVVKQAVREAAGEVRAAVAAARVEAARKRRGRGGEEEEEEEEEPEDGDDLPSDFDVPVFRTCALTGSGVAAAADWAARALPESPPLYPAHLLADAPERFFVAEIVREKIFLQYREEVPYACAVEVTEYIEREGAAKDYAAVSIFVERQQQKGILLGAGGSALKRLGAAARADAEVFLGRPLYMEISVKVAPKWRSDDRTVRQFGY